MNETPIITNIAYGAYGTTCEPENLWQAKIQRFDVGDGIEEFVRAQQNKQPRIKQQNLITQETTENMPDKNIKRIVRVFIADPDPKVQVSNSLLYSGSEQLTDLTDQELFFEIHNIKKLLDDHNEKRQKTEDKIASDRAGRQIFLEPIKIRDLRMIVVTVASF